MRVGKLCFILTAVAVLAMSCSMLKKSSDDGMVSVAKILADAKCPLSKDQQETLNGFSSSGGRGALRGIYEVFDEKQTDALKKVFGASPGRDGGPERPRFLFLVVMLENSGKPLTHEQLAKWKTLPNGREGFQAVREILTEDQNAVFQGMFNR